jgi:hydrogenase-1 operon protein HyaF
MTHTPRPFPIPVVAALGPGSQIGEDEEGPVTIDMPKDMHTYRPPVLPEPEELAAHAGALAVLRAALAALRACAAGQAVQPIALGGLGAADRAIVNQLLGEGEVAAQVAADAAGNGGIQAQESVFAGVWRVLHLQGGQVVRDTLEVGAVPQGLVAAAQADGAGWQAPDVYALPADVMNAPSILSELRDHQARWQPGATSHVVNLTLLPLTDGDSLWLQGCLGSGRVVILSRGYGNCRIVNTTLPRTWRVTYFNSQDLIILDTLEVGAVPEVACAAVQDLEDSAERLAEVLDWVATT